MYMILAKIRNWWKETKDLLRFALHLDLRAFYDPSFLTGQEPDPETLELIAQAKERAGLS